MYLVINTIYTIYTCRTQENQLRLKKKKKYCSHFFRLEQHKQNYLQKLISKAKESSVEDTKK